jgi:hypothetical protein
MLLQTGPRAGWVRGRGGAAAVWTRAAARDAKIRGAPAAALPTVALPNGFRAAYCGGEPEVGFLYREIYEERVYAQCGVRAPARC